MKVDGLARVEGEGALYVETDGDEVVDVQLRIYEPPRFFEAFLRGRSYTEPPDITARVCGICPVAYQLSACAAIEDACGAVVDAPLVDLRRLLYCGEWIESHTLHIYLLHAPDFLGYPGAVELARDAREVVEKGLKLKKVGNDLVERIGGRAVHPVNVKVGGFYRTPSRRELRTLRDPLLRARDLAAETVALVSGFDFPDLEHEHPYVALHSGDEYAVIGGRLRSSTGIDADVSSFADHVVEEQVPHSTALHAHLRDGAHYLVGPLARFELGGDLLCESAREAAAAAGVRPGCRNPYQSIVVRAVEVLHACETAIDLVDAYEEPERPAVAVEPRAGVGHGATEAPRGLLYHRYEIDDDGTILDAVMVPPTAQNQPAIEHDLFHVVERSIGMAEDDLRHLCEQTIRNYDPCISCSTHFLDMTVVDRATGVVP
ncbi:MAG: Ni/Fe hydrogenase subunit alpha [Acidimicrobiia bacterium]|nr:Ni/Fe hydrogenase subunit alpha [Acidimicrobiia bacterium]